MRVEALYFAQLKDSLKKERETFELPAGSTVADLLQKMMGRSREPFEGLNLKVAVNEELAEQERPLAEGDRVVFLPPVSGG